MVASGRTPSHYRLKDAVEGVRPVRESEPIIQVFFAAATAVAMAMCFFSLMSSMLTNIYEQSKEVAPEFCLTTQHLLRVGAAGVQVGLV